MSGFLKAIFYAVMVLIGVAAMYVILNAGNPGSLVRPLLPDPSHDVYLALGLSLVIFICGFVVFFFRDREQFRTLVRMNADTIRACRREGIGDAQIADQMMAAMGSRGGYRHNMARKKLILYLSEFE